MVSKKKRISKLEKDFEDIKKEIHDLKNIDFRLEVAKIKTEFLSLRGLINRKIGKLEKTEEPEENATDEKNFKGGILPI